VTTVGARTASRVVVAVWRWSAILVAGAALVFGYLGIQEHFRVKGGGTPGPLDLFYYDLQLFVLSSPPVDDGGPFPAMLQAARFAAPAVTVYALIEAARKLFAAELSRLRVRRLRQHHVVCGDGPVADALTRRLAGEGARVVRVRRSPELGGPRQSVLVGNPADAEVLRNAAVARARALYACTADSAVNMTVAMAVLQVRRNKRAVLQAHVHIEDPEMCLALQARRLGMPPTPGLQVNFFSQHELAARTLMDADPLPLAGDRPPRLMVIGAGPFGQTLVVELARSWRVLDTRGRRLEVTVVDPAADEAVSRLHRRYPFLAQTCELSPRRLNVQSLLDGDLPQQPPDRVYLCSDDEEAALRLALTMDQFWHRGAYSVVIRLNRLGLLRQAFHAPPHRRLLDDVGGTLYLFDAVRAGSDPRLVDDSLVERLARAIHDNYLANRLREGVALDATPAMRRWPDLGEDLRAENRAQASDIGRKLQAVGWALAPSPIWGRPAVLDEVALERLARMEHDRWLARLRERGWRYGARRDDAARVHPDMVEWAELPEPSREKDRETIRQLPQVLAEAGFQVVPVADLDHSMNGARSGSD
jgi:RyR domain/TrkA-N domain